MALLEKAIMRFSGLTEKELQENRDRRQAKVLSPPAEKKAIPTLSGGTALDFGRVWLGGQLEVDELTRWTAYSYSVYVYAAMQYRASKISEPDLWVAQEIEDGEEWLKDDPLQTVLEYPSPDYDMGFLRGVTSMYLDMDGEAVWHLVRDQAGRIARIYPYAKGQFQVYSSDVIQSEEQRLYAEFRLEHNTGGRVYGPEDVVYFRDHSLELTGSVTSRLDACLRWANMGEEVEKSLKQAFRKGVLPFTVFTYPAEYNPDEETRRQNRETLESRFGGSDNFARPLALYGGLEAAFNNIDVSRLMPTEVLDRVEANVSLAFGVRPEVLGYMVGLKNSPWSHMDTARRITYEDTIEPYWRREEKALSRQLLTPAEREQRKFIRIDTSGVRALQDDEKLKAEISKQNADIWTTDERRIYTGKEPLGGEIGDSIRASAPSGAPSDPASAEEEDQMLTARPPAEQKQARMTEIEWLENELACKADEQLWLPAMKEYQADRRKTILQAFMEWAEEEGETVSSHSLSVFLGEVQGYVSGPGRLKGQDIFRPVVRSTAYGGAKRLTARLGLGFDVVQGNLDVWVAKETSWLVNVLDETTTQQIAAVVQEALVDGLNFNEIIEEIQGNFAFEDSRASLVVRTETTRINNGARLTAAKEAQQRTGQRVQKRWMSSRDDRVRPEHDEMDDMEWYEIDHEFPVDGGCQSPNAPNCRCRLAYRTIRDEDTPLEESVVVGA